MSYLCGQEMISYRLLQIASAEPEKDPEKYVLSIAEAKPFVTPQLRLELLSRYSSLRQAS